MGGRPRAAAQGGEHKGGDKGKDEEKRSMLSKSFEPWEKWEEEDEDRWKEKEGRCYNQRKRRRYGRDKIFAVEYVTAVASTYQKPAQIFE